MQVYTLQGVSTYILYIEYTYRATVGLRCNRCERGFITATRGMGGHWMRNEATPLLTHFLSYCQ